VDVPPHPQGPHASLASPGDRGGARRFRAGDPPAPGSRVIARNAMPDPTSQELLDLTQRLLESISNGDWATYEELCDPSLTAVEPEALGHCVQGMAFHHFYFRRGRAKSDHCPTM